MIPIMTKEEKEKSEMEKLKEQNRLLENQMLVLMDMSNLKDDSFYRRQMLLLLERIALSLETSLKNSEETESKDE